MSAINAINNNAFTLNNNVALAEPLANEEAPIKEAKTPLGQKPVASNSWGTDTYDNKINPLSAEARNIAADEHQTYNLNGGFSATRTRSSIGHDDAYFKTLAPVNSPAVNNGDFGGYDVHIDGSSTKVATHGGQELGDYISGISVREGSLIGSDKAGAAFSNGISWNNEALSAAIRLNSFMLDGRYNFRPGEESGALSSNMGTLGGSGFGSLRYLFAKNRLLQGTIGFTAGRAPNLGSEGTTVLALGGHVNSHIFDHSFLDDSLRLSIDAQSKMSLPLLSPNPGTNVLNNMTLNSLVTVGAEFDLSSSVTLGAKYSENYDPLHGLKHLATPGAGLLNTPISRFAEVSAAYGRENFDVAANIYVPVSIYDSAFSDNVTWNVQSGYGFDVLDGLFHAGVSASVSGHFAAAPVSKVSGNLHFGPLSAGAFVSGIDSGKLSVGFNASLSLSAASLVALWGLK